MQIEEFVSNYNSIYITTVPPNKTRLNFLFRRVFCLYGCFGCVFQKIFKIAIKINEKSFFPAIMEVEKRRRFDARMG